MDNIPEYIQNPIASVVINEINEPTLVLRDWDVEELSAYTLEEANQLVDMLQQSINIMVNYKNSNESLPLFEKVVSDVEQEATLQ